MKTFTELSKIEQMNLMETFDGIINSADKLYIAASEIFEIIKRENLKTEISEDDFEMLLNDCSKYSEALDELF